MNELYIPERTTKSHSITPILGKEFLRLYKTTYRHLPTCEYEAPNV